jgi:hypothetical protein
MDATKPADDAAKKPVDEKTADDAAKKPADEKPATETKAA